MSAVYVRLTYGVDFKRGECGCLTKTPRPADRPTPGGGK